MAEEWIGTGGWGYFRGPSGRALKDYARGFRFVEVNTTFYRHPVLPTVRAWRRSVPPSFRFAVKVHRDVTHREGLRASRRAMGAMARDATIARILGSDLLVLQTPPDLRLGADEAKGLRDLAGTVPSSLRIAVEPRAYRARRLPRPLAEALRDINGIDIVDLSRGEAPRVHSDITYSRLFGAPAGNAWEFSDDELRSLASASDSRDVARVVFTFHGVKMYKDAARYVAFRRSGAFPPATEGRGVEGLREVLRPDARFPARAEDLLRDHGWKVLALGDGRNVHAEDLLRKLPQGQYRSVDDVITSVRGPFARVPTP